MNDENTQWYDGLNLDEESLSTVTAKGWTDANSIIKSYRELEKFSGQDKNDFIKIGKNEDGTFDYSEVYTRLGKPEKAEDYELPDSDFTNEIKEVLFKNGITKSQAKALQEFIDDYADKSEKDEAQRIAAELETAHNKAVEGLKKEWGADFDKNVELCKTVTKEFGLTDEQLDSIGEIMGTDKVAKMFLRLASRSDSEQPLTGYNNNKTSKDSAISRIAELQNDAAFMKRVSDGDPQAVAEMMSLAANTVVDVD